MICTFIKTSDGLATGDHTCTPYQSYRPLTAARWLPGTGMHARLHTLVCSSGPGFHIEHVSKGPECAENILALPCARALIYHSETSDSECSWSPNQTQHLHIRSHLHGWQSKVGDPVLLHFPLPTVLHCLKFSSEGNSDIKRMVLNARIPKKT